MEEFYYTIKKMYLQFFGIIHLFFIFGTVDPGTSVSRGAMGNRFIKQLTMIEQMAAKIRKM